MLAMLFRYGRYVIILKGYLFRNRNKINLFISLMLGNRLQINE